MAQAAAVVQEAAVLLGVEASASAVAALASAVMVALWGTVEVALVGAAS